MNPLVSKSLKLPDGYQSFNKVWFSVHTQNRHGVQLDPVKNQLAKALKKDKDATLYMYTQHQLVLDGVVKQTRSSPNWEGGMVTYATCKHNMRTWGEPEDWEGRWIAGLNPADIDNSLLFVGKVHRVFPNNFELGGFLRRNYPTIAAIKAANHNPRGDIYQPKKDLGAKYGRFDHRSFLPPKNHTRSVDKYSTSPGSVDNCPKWWRDHEYVTPGGKRPPCFILKPCFLYPHPSLVMASLKPGRAVLKLTVDKFLKDLISY